MLPPLASRIRLAVITICICLLITPAAHALRCIPMAPTLVETMFAIGAGDMVVGIPEYSTFPEEALRLPSVGGYFNPNLERIAALKPDLVILQGKHEKLDRFCKAEGIRTLRVTIEDLASIKEGISIVGKAVGKEAEALALNEKIAADIAALRRATGHCPKEKVFVVIGRTPGTLSQIMTAGGPTYFTELLAIAGATNLFADIKQRYPMISKESVLARQPDRILEFAPGVDPEDPILRKKAAEWKKLGATPAVTNGHIHVLTDNRLLLPGPRIAEAAALLKDLLACEVHP